MSTKTTFKRIALVTVAALGFGLLSVAPSSATAQSDTLTLGTTATPVANNTAASTTLTQTYLGVAGDTMTVTIALVSGPSGNTTVPTLARVVGSDSNGTTSVSGLVGTLTDTATSYSTYTLVSGTYTLGLPATTLAGTYVIKATPAITGGGGTAVAAAVTWTVTVAASTTNVAPDVTSNFVLDATPASLGTGSTNAVIVVPVSSGSAVAAIRVVPRANSIVTTGSLTMTTTITGPGTITAGNVSTLVSTSGARSLTTNNTGGNGFWVYVYGDGTAGTSTVTMTIGSVVSTKTVTFYGAAASVTSTLVQPVVAVGSSGFGVGAITANAKDAAGNAVPGASLWVVSSDPTVIANGTSAVVTAGSTGAASFDLVGLKAGTTNITIQNVAAGSTATFSAAALAVRVGSNVGASVVLSLDKATYAQGEAAVVTVTVKDAAGNPVANGTYTPFSAAATSTRTVTGTLPGTSHVTTGSANGAVTYAINVPTTTGDFTISASAGSGWTGTFSATATVAPSAESVAAAEAIAAAADAAAEATDAANAATDAANAAAEAADAATAAAQDAADAIAALSVQVGELVAGLTAQITAQKAAIRALTNLVIKIQKAVNKKK